jgi:hypothetical protein
MPRLTRPMMAACAAAIVLALGFGLLAALATTPAEAKGPCRCPQIYAPVECDNGKTYPNQCVADCRGGKNCVPTGEI